MYHLDTTPLGALKVAATRSPGDTLTEEDVAAIEWAVARIRFLENGVVLITEAVADGGED